MKLVDYVVRSFRVAKVISTNKEAINSIDYSSDGGIIITSSDDESMVIYDCRQGVLKTTLYSKKYGVCLIRFTQNINTVLHGSTKVDNSLRQLSLQDNKYIRYYQGHARTVISLDRSPVDDTFITSSQDKTVRLWDLRSPYCQGTLYLKSSNNNTKPAACFDPEGIIFAVLLDSTVHLYDMKTFDKGSFNCFKLPENKEVEYTEIKFSPNGKAILVSTNGSIAYLIDSFQGKKLQEFTNYENETKSLLGTCFSPDSQFVFGGSSNGRIHAWSSSTGLKISEWSSGLRNPVNCVKFNPKYMLVSSACHNMSFWLPQDSSNY